MSDTDKKADQEKGDEILRKMLNMPPDPKIKAPDGERKKTLKSKRETETK